MPHGASAGGLRLRRHREEDFQKYPIKKIRTLALVDREGSGNHNNRTCDCRAIEKRFHRSLKQAVANLEAQA